MPINYSAIQAALQEFVTSVSNVQGASIMSPDGLAIASSLPANMEEDRVAAMSAAMLALGERMGKELVRGTIQRVVVEGEKGFATIAACTADAVVVVLADEKVKLGVLNLEIKQLVERVRPLLTFSKPQVA